MRRLAALLCLALIAASFVACDRLVDLTPPDAAVNNPDAALQTGTPDASIDAALDDSMPVDAALTD